MVVGAKPGVFCFVSYDQCVGDVGLVIVLVWCDHFDLSFLCKSLCIELQAESLRCDGCLDDLCIVRRVFVSFLRNLICCPH